MKKINFSKIMVEINFEGDIVEYDLRKQIGNAIHVNTVDIGLDDFARKIYNSEGPVDVPDEYIQPIMSIISREFVVPVQQAVVKLLEN